MKNFTKGIIVGLTLALVLNVGYLNADSITATIDVLINDVALEVNGENVSSETILYSGTTYVPLRAVAEMLNLNVTWDGETRTAGLKSLSVSPLESEKIVGQWVAIDFVRDIADFEPDRQHFRDELYLSNLIFEEDGDITGKPWWNWVDGVLIHSGDDTASHYYIKEIDDVEYMFLEWKSGDYSIRGMEPKFYVFERNTK